MRFLVDEGCDFAVVRALRSAGHDVAAIAELNPGLDDDTVIAMAVTEGRVLVTEDKDFGRRVHFATSPTVGVVLIRFPVGARARLGATVAELAARHGASLVGAFAVVEPGRVRLARP